MRQSLLVTILALCLAFPTGRVFAEEPLALLEGAFGNTISIVNALGDETLVWLKRDQTYESKLPNGARHKGIWSVEGDLICFKITDPPSEANKVPICGPLIANRKPGDQWESMVSDGSIVTISIKEGVVEGS